MSNEWDTAFPDILASILPAASRTEITPDLDLQHAGLDSFAVIDLLIRLEDRYDIMFADDDLVLTTFSTPQALWHVVSKLREHDAYDGL